MERGHARVVRFVMALLIGVAAVSGCGSGAGKSPVAKVSGKVTFDGQAVTGGTISLFPTGAAKATEAGKAGICLIQSDGSFKASTYGEFDGAIIGKHQVMYSPPSVETPVVPEGGHAQAPPPSPYDGLVAKETQVEVKAGENSINIELVKGATPTAGPGTPTAGPGTPAAAHGK